MCKELEDWLQEEKSAGEDRMAKLINKLMVVHRSQDIPLALNDVAARQKLYQEFHIE